MAAVDWTALAPKMLAAVKGVFGKQWPEAKDYAQSELRKLQETLELIGRLTVTGKMTPEEAALQLQIQKNSARTVLLTLEGIGVLTAEEAMNAALEIPKSAVNTALGFALL
jgi:hypothetical protein